MSNEQILKQAIEKAVKNGYKIPIHIEPLTLSEGVFSIIFSHSFAKAFFGDIWTIRLENMVLEEDPIQYLKKFL